MSPLEGFEEIYRLYYKDVYRYVLSMCLDQDLAEEIAQEAFFKAMINAKSFHGDSSVKTWILKIARNEYYNRNKKQKRLQSMDQSPELISDIDLSEEIIRKETISEIYRRYENLKEPYKEVFFLKCFSNLPFAEIGKIFEKSESWARVTYFRAKQKIKEECHEGKL